MGYKYRGLCELKGLGVKSVRSADKRCTGQRVSHDFIRVENVFMKTSEEQCA